MIQFLPFSVHRTEILISLISFTTLLILNLLFWQTNQKSILKLQQLLIWWPWLLKRYRPSGTRQEYCWISKHQHWTHWRPRPQIKFGSSWKCSICGNGRSRSPSTCVHGYHQHSREERTKIVQLLTCKKWLHKDDTSRVWWLLYFVVYYCNIAFTCTLVR